jgi:single-strand DNA-binding protein
MYRRLKSLLKKKRNINVFLSRGASHVASFNRIIIAGRLTRDPKLEPVGANQVCRLGIASNRQFKNKQTGAIEQDVCFVDVDVWGIQAESTNKYLEKGSPVLIEGRLKFDQWKDAEGTMKSRHSIVAERVVFLGNRQDGKERSLNDLSDGRGMDSSAFSGASSGSRKSTASSGMEDFKDQPFDESQLPF